MCRGFTFIFCRIFKNFMILRKSVDFVILSSTIYPQHKLIKNARVRAFFLLILVVGDWGKQNKHSSHYLARRAPLSQPHEVLRDLSHDRTLRNRPLQGADEHSGKKRPRARKNAPYTRRTPSFRTGLLLVRRAIYNAKKYI